MEQCGRGLDCDFVAFAVDFESDELFHCTISTLLHHFAAGRVCIEPAISRAPCPASQPLAQALFERKPWLLPGDIVPTPCDRKQDECQRERAARISRQVPGWGAAPSACLRRTVPGLEPCQPRRQPPRGQPGKLPIRPA